MKYRINKGGFTLLELVMVSVIIGFIVLMALPTLNRSQAKWELDIACRQLATDIRQWQRAAITEQEYGLKILVNVDQKTYDLRDGMTIIETCDLSGLINSINVTTGFNPVEFYPTGSTSAAGHYTLQSKYGDTKYVIILNTTGRVRISSTLPGS